jgi:hypothetical protein
MNKIKFIFILVIIILLWNNLSYCQNSNSPIFDDHQGKFIGYFYEPYPIEKHKLLLQLGGSFTLLPIPVAENELIVPTIDLQSKYAISDNFCMIGSLFTNFFSNVLHSGLQWNKNFDRFSVGIANNIGIFVGYVSLEEQFENNTALVYFYLPTLKAGYRLDDASISLTLGANYILYGHSKISEVNSVGVSQTWNMVYVTLAFEQPIFRRSYASFGFSVDFSKTPYQSWLMYNTTGNNLFVPEFFFSFQL